MTRPAIFFDRDNTLIVCDGYLGDPRKVQLIAGAADAVARSRALGFVVVAISNQSGVARGMFSEDDVASVNARLDEMLREENSEAIIDRHEFCPYHPEALLEHYRQDSELRKPRPGMIRRAADALDLDLPNSWMIGDTPRDMEAGRAAGCRAILVRDPSLTASPAASEPLVVQPDETVWSLAEAMDIIESAVESNESAPPTEITLGSLETSRQRLRIGRQSEENPARAVVTAGPQIASHAAPPVTQSFALKLTAGDADAQAQDKLPPSPDPQNLAEPMPRPASTPATATTLSDKQAESIATRIIEQLARHDTPAPINFSISKLFAGITQAVAGAAAIMAYFYHGGSNANEILLAAIFLELLTIALVLMGRDR